LILKDLGLEEKLGLEIWLNDSYPVLKKLEILVKDLI